MTTSFVVRYRVKAPGMRSKWIKVRRQFTTSQEAVDFVFSQDVPYLQEITVNPVGSTERTHNLRLVHRRQVA